MKTAYFFSIIIFIISGCKRNPDGSVSVVPITPSSLNATAVSTSQINLTWTDNSTNETGFKIERKSGTGNYTIVATTGDNVTSFQDIGLPSNTTYTYRVYSYNQVGNSLSYSNESTATTARQLSLPILTTLNITDISSTGATSGGEISDDGGSPVISRGIVWSTSPNPITTLSTKTSDGNGTGNFISTLSNLTANTQYYVRAYAVNSIGVSYGNEISFTTKQNVNIYVAGEETNSNGILVAKYWKNGIGINLSDGTKSAGASSIAVVGNDVYAAGYENTSSGLTIAKYWKNGIAVNLTDGAYRARGESITINGNDIYVAGYENSGSGISIAKYWKNGIPITLSSTSSQANAVLINGNDVYIVGWEVDATGWPYAKYWKNGIAFNLSQGDSTVVHDAFFNGLDFYIVGTGVRDGIVTASYWKNGIITVVPDAGSGSSAYTIAANSTGVYLAGEEQARATYWKNGTIFRLSNTIESKALAIKLDGSDIYIAGDEKNSSGIRIAKYWKNGTSFNLSTTNSSANAIFISY